MLTHCECPRCGTVHDASTLLGVCSCGSPLLARYDLEAVGSRIGPSGIAGRDATLWRYRELLPLPLEVEPVTLGEGMTPLLPCPRLGQDAGEWGSARSGLGPDGPRPRVSKIQRGVGST